MKKVLLIVIDAFASRVVRPAMEQGRLPNLQALAAAGKVEWNSTAIFPSITPAATAALVTGGYPVNTGISGAHFYDYDRHRLHYYGESIWPVLRKGFANFFEDFLVRMNRDQLRGDTVFQLAERAGMQAACLNYLWFRGDAEHEVRLPLLLRLWPTIPFSETIYGPKILSLGDFISDKIPGSEERLHGPGGMFRRFGFADEATGKQLLQLAKRQAFPEFTVAYFPDNDFTSHSDGPEAALRDVEQVDQILGQLADCYGGVEGLLQSLAIVITGDHAQCDLQGDEKQNGVMLDEILKEFKVAPAGAEWQERTELLVCPNMRAAQIYIPADQWDARDKLIETLLAHERVDQVIWRDDESEKGTPPDDGGGAGARRWFCVRTRRDGLLRFTAGAATSSVAQDEYGNAWSWEGNLAAVDGRIDAVGTLRFGDYPNAFERIATSFDDRVSGDVWVTSQLGHEFYVSGTDLNKGGSHGSLHAHDSLSPLILAGVPDELLPKKTPRSVDVAPLCLALLGLKSPYEAGSGRVGTKRDSSRSFP